MLPVPSLLHASSRGTSQRRLNHCLCPLVVTILSLLGNPNCLPQKWLDVLWNHHFKNLQEFPERLEKPDDVAELLK